MLKIILALFAVSMVLSYLTTDSTDKGFKKSGLGLYIDNATGCHYIQGGIFGNMIPRLDKTGKQICTGYDFEKLNKR